MSQLKGLKVSQFVRINGRPATAVRSFLPLDTARDAVGRNQPCLCGSGRKYKQCCLDAGARPGPAHPGPDALRDALACHRAGDLGRAEKLYRRVLRSQPAHFDALHMLGVLMGQRGQTDEAVALIREALALNPGSAEGYNNLGSFLHARRNHPEAVAALETAIAIRPDYPEALNNLGNALRHTQRPLSDAIRCYEKAIRLQPAYAEAHLNLGLALLQQDRLDEAASRFRCVLKQNPQSAVAHHNLGLALQRLGQFDDAITSYESALAARPGNAETHNNLGNIHRTAGQLKSAAASYRRALELRPAYAEAGCNMAQALSELDRYDEALDRYRAVLAAHPHHREALYGMARMLQQLGRFKEAAAAYLELLHHHPQFADAYLGYAGCKRVSIEDRPVVDGMEALIAGGAGGGQSRAALHFALGKAYDDLQDYETAFKHYRQANDFYSHQRRFDQAGHKGAIESIMRVYDREALRPAASERDMGCVPVFIVGMPRSGTTLVEDLLSRHPAIAAGGELDFWARFEASPSDAGGIRQDTHAAAGQYAGLLTRLSGGAGYVTDKLTTNFLRLGLLHSLLPGARIIHCRRNPIDTCLSCYFTRFAGTHDYAYDLEDLAFYYEQYRRLMSHWRKLLPPSHMTEIDYEEIVADPEDASRRLIEFCGLDWKTEYMLHTRERRAIRTASKWQVRQPVYKTSVERWRRYEAFLGPLMRLAM